MARIRFADRAEFINFIKVLTQSKPDNNSYVSRISTQPKNRLEPPFTSQNDLFQGVVRNFGKPISRYSPRDNIAQSFALAKEVQNRAQAAADQDINRCEENRSERSHDKDHDSGQNHFAARRPNNF